MAMNSQLRALKETVARLRARNPGGEDSPFVKGLLAQIDSYEKPRAENPMSNFQAGSRGAPQTGKTKARAAKTTKK